jgi:hypothetical protein
MADIHHDELAEILAQLRDAVSELRMRGLNQATKFASELVLGIPDALRKQLSSTGVRAFDRYESASSDAFPLEDLDRYEAAKASFDVGEYLRAHHMLANAPMGRQTHFLKHYALYMVRICWHSVEERGNRVTLCGCLW